MLYNCKGCLLSVYAVQMGGLFTVSVCFTIVRVVYCQYMLYKLESCLLSVYALQL